MAKVAFCACLFLGFCAPVIWWFEEVGNDKYDSSTYLECSGVKDAVANGKTNIVPDCFIDETDGVIKCSPNPESASARQSAPSQQASIAMSLRRARAKTDLEIARSLTNDVDQILHPPDRRTSSWAAVRLQWCRHTAVSVNN